MKKFYLVIRTGMSKKVYLIYDKKKNHCIPVDIRVEM